MSDAERAELGHDIRIVTFRDPKGAWRWRIHVTHSPQKLTTLRRYVLRSSARRAASRLFPGAEIDGKAPKR